MRILSLRGNKDTKLIKDFIKETYIFFNQFPNWKKIPNINKGLSDNMIMLKSILYRRRI